MRQRSHRIPRPGRSAAFGWLCCLLTAASALAGAPGPLEEPEPLPERVAAGTEPVVAVAEDPAAVWQSLRYEGSALVGAFGATLELRSAASGKPPRWIASLRTRMRSALLPDKETTVRAWFDPATAQVDHFEKLKLGPGPSFKRFVFREGGADRYRKEPGPGEDSRRHETWLHEKQSFLPFAAAAHGCRLVSDPGALVYWVSFGPGRWEEDPGACVVSGKTLYRIAVRPRGTASQEIRYRVHGGEQPVRAGRSRLARYEVVGTPVAGELEESVVRVDILVEEQTELPWKVVVREGPFELDVQLAEVVLRER